jgi:H+/Cl- antiporter ClcA
MSHSKQHPHFITSLQGELYDWRLWSARVVVLAFASIAGLTVVVFTWMCELAFENFNAVQQQYWWMPLLWTPVVTAVIVWLTRRLAPGAAGSGIPQVMAALAPEVHAPMRHYFVSIWLTVSKMVLTALGMLAGLSLGREGPSVQIGAGIMHSCRRWLPKRGVVSDHGLLIAGGAAGIAAAFNTPLGGIMFAIEELSRSPQQRSNGLIMAAIVLGGLMSVSVFGNSSYFGIVGAIRVDRLDLEMLLPGLVVTIACGLAGGLFARLLIVSLSGQSNDWFSRMRARFPVRFAAMCGLAVAVIGVASNGSIFGSGYLHTRDLLDGVDESSGFFFLLKFVATWITTWAGVPAGIFAPSLAIGGGIGSDVAQFMLGVPSTTLIAVGMAAFLAAVTQAPMTSFIIVMEMVDGHGLVLSLMASALLASGVSRLVSAPLYAALADLQVRRVLPTEPPLLAGPVGEAGSADDSTAPAPAAAAADGPVGPADDSAAGPARGSV